MLDLRSIRDDPAPYRDALAKRGAADDLDRALALDERRRALTVRVETLRAEQNRRSKEIGAALPDKRQEVIASVRAVSDELNQLEPQLAAVEDELAAVQTRLPNIPHPTVPVGDGDDDNVVVRTGGPAPRVLDFEPRDHLELGEALGMIDVERAVKTSGSRFAYLLGAGVRIQFALVQYGLDFAIERGLLPVVPPVLVRREALFGTGFLPSGEEQIYVTRDDDLYLVGTSEVSLASFHAGEILEPHELPKRYVGYSTCFRREAGTYGKDMRGIFRLHQFDKLEMFTFVLPEESDDEHERLLAWEEEFVTSLDIPYRVVNVCTGELGAPAAKKYDIEAWLPSQGRYREITSASNTTDFQARRLEIRVRGEDRNRPLHTLNGTLCAIGRTLIALLENGQQADGSLVLPEVLNRYLPEGLL